MKPIKTILLLAAMLLLANTLPAQVDYLKQAREYLAEGNCDGAQTYYDLALQFQLNNKRDNNLERQIAECIGDSNEENGTANGHEYVDLGLPSGTLWATCNIGASKPEDYGSYFAWGETQTKTTYNWDTYKYATGENHRLTKYCNVPDYGYNGFTDNLSTLQGSDDPAAAKWGSGWRTPSKAQWEELKNNTTHKWTTRNGKQGRLFTAKNGLSVFLPAAGNCWGSESINVGSEGCYWSWSLYTDDPPRAWYLYFYSDDCSMRSNYRRYGFSVRPVREK